MAGGKQMKKLKKEKSMTQFTKVSAHHP